MRGILIAAATAGLLLSCGAASADPWKDESGHGRWGGGKHWKHEGDKRGWGGPRGHAYGYYGRPRGRGYYEDRRRWSSRYDD